MATVRSYQPMCSSCLRPDFCALLASSPSGHGLSVSPTASLSFFQYVKDLQQLKSTLTAYCVRLHLAFRNFI